jgi:23S rRNA (cytosine1962-C5)-methyltransferase
MSGSPIEFPTLCLKKNEERRLKAGHLWVYSNEVETAVTPLQNFEPGQAVAIQTHGGKLLGTGYVNPHSLICARLLSRDPAHPFSPLLLLHRLQLALTLRERLYSSPFYRLVYGEADGLPGLIIDRFADVCVVQLTTAGMELCKKHILQGLDTLLKPTGVLWRNDSPIREREGLTRYIEVAAGHVPSNRIIEENKTRFQIPLIEGQKTGWFYDQQDNRHRAIKYMAHQRVLDLYSYVGAWGIQAAAHGAREVLCVDASATALEHLTYNAHLNHVDKQVTSHRGDVFSVLKSLRSARQRFDVIILDPPAFIKSRKNVREGMQGYRRLNEMAMQILEKDGTLISCSCSQLLSQEMLKQLLSQAAMRLNRSLQILEHGQQGPDHPVHPIIPETQYLKALFTRLSPP